jgi:hypothetical protein
MKSTPFPRRRPLPVLDPTSRLRLLCALAAFPAGWAVRQAVSPAVGGIVVLALIAATAFGLPRRTALLTLAAGVGCFVAVHLIAYVTTIGAGLGCGALLYAAIGWRLWRDGSSSSARRATPAT